MCTAATFNVKLSYCHLLASSFICIFMNILKMVTACNKMATTLCRYIHYGHMLVIAGMRVGAKLYQHIPDPEVINYCMLNRTEHEISTAQKI